MKLATTSLAVALAIVAICTQAVALDLGIVGAAPDVSDDGLTMYFADNSGIWYVTRNTVNDPWSWPAVTKVPLSTKSNGDPSISSDELTLYYHSKDKKGRGNEDIWKITRSDKNSKWDTLTNCGEVINSENDEGSPEISPDGLTLYHNYHDTLPSGIWFNQRTNIYLPWGEPEELEVADYDVWEGDPSISGDGLILVFVSGRPGGYGGMDIWYRTRYTVYDRWSPPTNAGPKVNTANNDGHPAISAIDNKLYFDRDVDGKSHIFCAEFVRKP